jgi:hypothetical protein
MKTITQEDFKALEFVPRNQDRPVSPVITALKEVSEGEGLVISKDEWTYKTPPANYINSYFHSRGNRRFKIRTLADRKAWAILRIQ